MHDKVSAKACPEEGDGGAREQDDSGSWRLETHRIVCVLEVLDFFALGI